MCLADNVDSLEDDETGLDDVPLDSESELWSDGIDSTYSAVLLTSFFKVHGWGCDF